MEPTNYPLAWPPGVPRHKGPRHFAAFSRRTRQISTTGASYARTRELSVADGVDRVRVELARFGVATLVISTNLKVRRDGLPYSDQRDPADPGAAVYFTLKKRPYCLPCDRWTRVADNLAAIAAHIAALRGIERWGVGTVEQAFTGYLALPDPNWINWRDVFPGVETLDALEQAYREQARGSHPDANGSHDTMVRLNRARDLAREELSA